MPRRTSGVQSSSAHLRLAGCYCHFWSWLTFSLIPISRHLITCILESRTRGRSIPQAARKPEHLARPVGQEAGIGLLYAYIRQFNPTIFQNGEDKKPPFSRCPASPRSQIPAFPTP